MATKFNHQELERKWQAHWKETGIYQTGPRDTSREKRFILTEFPYPSGNLHIGHWYAFAVPDIYVRKLRMDGKQVLYPVGFDSFGLPAENAAIKRKLDPHKWTYDNIAYMTSQLESMGNAYDWSRLVITSNPEYYRWTQWIFTQFFENDLAYRGVGIVNWCPSCNTVLANEQVIDHSCERCGSKVEQREMPEWKMRISRYADRLVDDLAPLPWPEYIKDLQRNWIGRSYGALIDFKLHFTFAALANDERGPNGEGAVVSVFTTRADTLFGATFLVLAPEHPWVSLATDESRTILENRDGVLAYVTAAKLKDAIERGDNTREKTGIELKGVVAINPANGEHIPLFVADYVLGGYGTGAIMAVPAHDERDYAFAQKYHIAVKEVIGGEVELPRLTPGVLVHSGEFDGLESEAASDAIVAKVHGTKTATYRLRDWSIGRQRYWGVPIPIVYDPEGKAHPVPPEHLPWLLPTDVDVTPTGEPPLAKSAELRERTERIFGRGWTPEVETMDTFVDSSWYFLRYTDPNNESSLADVAKQKEWLPIDVYLGGSEHTTMHLLYSRFVQKALFDLGHTPVDEPFRVRYNRGLVLGPDGNKMSKSKGNVIDPDEQVARLGADTVKMYLAFMGPYGIPTNYPWDMGGIAGIRRFLERVYDLHEKIRDDAPIDTTKLLHKTIEKVTSDIDLMKFNTAISALMVFVNTAEKGLLKADYALFLTLLAPFAPHLTEELWSMALNKSSIHTEAWPLADSALLVVTSVTIAVQINGRVRETIVIDPEATEAEALRLALAQAGVQSRLGTKIPTKVIYVKGKILNLIVPEASS